jgi:hypothetical protein
LRGIAPQAPDYSPYPRFVIPGMTGNPENS